MAEGRILTAQAVLKYPVVFLAGLLTALVLSLPWEKWAADGTPRTGRANERFMPSVPRGGGVAVFGGFHAAWLCFYCRDPVFGQLSMDWWFRFSPLSTGVLVADWWMTDSISSRWSSWLAR